MATTGRPGVYTSENFAPLALNTAIPGEAIPAIAAAHPRGPLAPTLITSWNQFVKNYGTFTQAPNSILPFAVYEFFVNGGSQLFVLRLPNSNATNPSLDLDGIGTGSDAAVAILTVTSLSPGVWAQEIFIEIVSRRATYFDMNVYLGSSANNAVIVETFQDLSMDPSSTRYAPVLINSPSHGSQYISVLDNISGDGIPVGTGLASDSYIAGTTDLQPVAPTQLTGGGDGDSAPNLGVTIPQGFDTLLDQVLVLNVPGLSDSTTLNTLINWCESKKDKFLVIDGPAPVPAQLPLPGYSTTCASTYIGMVQTGSGSLVASTYAAVYGPWVLVQDPSSIVPGACRWMPPGALMLGQYNATDHSRGAFVTPAGTKNVLNVVALETQFSQTDLDNLNNAQVNAIKLVPGVGFCPFGGRTLHMGYPDRYIAVRRMIIQLEHDFKWILKGFLFEPNDYLLWRQITAAMQNYLTQQLQINALGGSTPADSFRVVCDATNNTPQLASAGVVTVDVAVSLNSPAEFININLTQMQGEGTTTVTTTS